MKGSRVRVVRVCALVVVFSALQACTTGKEKNEAAVGTVVSAAIASALGRGIGASMEDGDREKLVRTIEEVPAGQITRWRNEQTGIEYNVTTVTDFYDRGDARCRDIRQVMTIDGRHELLDLTACKHADSQVWHVEGSPKGEPLPAYPWPPEQPSSIARLEQVLCSTCKKASLAEVESDLRSALGKAGYHESGLYSVPGGFAMITRLEGIDERGFSLGEGSRYVPPGETESFSLAEYVHSLFFAPQGFYRFALFVVTDVPYANAAEVLGEADAVARLHQGAVALPFSYRHADFSSLHRVDVLIYEFQKARFGDGIRNLEFLRPGRLSPRAHLENAGLLVKLHDHGFFLK